MKGKYCIFYERSRSRENRFGGKQVWGKARKRAMDEGRWTVGKARGKMVNKVVARKKIKVGLCVSVCKKKEFPEYFIRRRQIFNNVQEDRDCNQSFNENVNPRGCVRSSVRIFVISSKELINSAFDNLFLFLNDHVPRLKRDIILNFHFSRDLTRLGLSRARLVTIAQNEKKDYGFFYIE